MSVFDLILKMKVIIYLIISIIFINKIESFEIILESENVTDWGEWGPWEYCPKGSFGSAFQIKTEQHPSSSKIDDTGLNGIKLICSKIGSYDPVGKVTSSEGDFGDWGIKFRCGGGYFINGFQLKNLKPQHGSKSGRSSLFGAIDDYGATNLRIFCTNGDTLDGDGLDIGDWGRKMTCLTNQYICAIRTQIEYNLPIQNSIWNGAVDDRWIGFGDYTGLNNLRMKCCEPPNPAEECIPSDSWETILACDATSRVSPFICKFDKTVGVSQTNGETIGTSQNTATTNSYSIGSSIPFLSINFGINYSKSQSTGHDWKHESSTTWNTASTTSSEFGVQPGQRSELQQVVGRCGHFVIRTMNLRVIDFDRYGNILG